MLTLFATAGDFADAISLARQFGPFFLAVVFFLWRDWKREDRLSNRLDELEDEQREVILPLVKDCGRVKCRLQSRRLLQGRTRQVPSVTVDPSSVWA